MTACVVYEDVWGEIIARPDREMVEIRWFESTLAMDGEAFNTFLDRYATEVERAGARSALVDAVQFRMPMERMNVGWRDENIVPRYNAAGLRKFAFVMPDGATAPGEPPRAEGPADYPTAYFSSRASAIAWLAT